jgi:TPR repeat protein
MKKIISGIVISLLILSTPPYASEADDHFSKGKELDKVSKYVEAIEWHRKAADLGHAEAQYVMGICYSRGQGVTQDYVSAVEWYRKSAEQGFADAQDALGQMYETGKGVEMDKDIAVSWYMKAAEQQNTQ